MPALFNLLFKINIALVLFCLGYYLVLRHLTFYTLNRIYLVAAILFSSAYPWINLTGFVQRHQQLAAPMQNVILRWKAPAENLIKPLGQPDYWQWAEVVFWLGVIVFALRLITQLLSLYKLYRRSDPAVLNAHKVRIVKGDISPFSFWRNIYINPGNLPPADLQKVLEHEQIHVSEWHTLDILLAELSTVFYWFNPGIWLMKKAVRENVEFITDRKILQKGADSKQYQYSLLSVSMAGAPNNLVNNFNMSTIKKRIIMMNTKRSSRLNLTRYLFVAPAVIALLLVFSISKADVTKKGLNTLHSFTKAITHFKFASADKPAALPAQKALPAVSVLKTKNVAINPDTIYAGKSKDGKRNMMVTSDKGVDSVLYVINGAKSVRADLLALDPGKIYSLDMISADIAKRYVDFTLDKPEVLFVTIDGSEKGMSLKERIDKDMTSGELATTRNMAIAGSPDIAPNPPSGMSYSYTVRASGSNDRAPVTVSGRSNNSSATVVSSDNAPDVVTIDGKTQTINNARIANAPEATGIVIAGSEDKVPADAVKLVTTDSKGEKHINYMYEPQKTLYTIKTSNTDELTVDNPHMLIIINGEEAKSMKNISPMDIRSLTVLKNKAAEKKYGSKGKYGVIEITTKNR
ncbi:MAG TPA: M56 family metallopeptidase [Mucilaginibacter sp.]|nr:M56 family metallopeptidase [Mucilaginibacter sp.]